MPVRYYAKCDCGRVHEWPTFAALLEFAMDDTNDSCCRGTAASVITEIAGG